MPLTLSSFVLQSFAMLLTVLLIPRLKLSGISGILLMVAALALVNTYLWDAALFFSLPDSVTMRAGLLFLANGAIFWLLVKLLPGIEIDGVLPAFAAPVVLSISSVLVGKYGSQVDWSDAIPRAAAWTVETFHSLRAFFE